MSTNVKKIKSQIIPLLKKAGVLKSSLFGSIARGDAKQTSDVDILVDMSKNADLLDFVRLKFSLEKKLRRKVDLVTFDNLSPFIKTRVNQEQIEIL